MSDFVRDFTVHYAKEQLGRTHENCTCDVKKNEYHNRHKTSCPYYMPAMRPTSYPWNPYPQVQSLQAACGKPWEWVTDIVAKVTCPECKEIINAEQNKPQPAHR